MSRLEDDYLARLLRQKVPEPDQARMQATIRTSTDLFEREMSSPARSAQAPSPASRFLRWLARPSGWIAPVAAGGVAVAAAVAIIPSLSTGPALSPRHEPLRPAPFNELAPDVEAAPPTTAQAPAVPREESAPASPRRMGVQREPTARGSATPIFPIERYSFEGLTLGVRNMPEAAELLLLESDNEQRLNITIKNESQRIALFDAFRDKTVSGQDMIVVRSGMGSNQRWDVFLRGEQGYSRSVELSLRIQDAPNRDAAKWRLQQP